MARLHWVDLPVGLESLAKTWVIEASGILFAVEFFADKIPVFDVVWNVLHTFVRIPVAALLAYQAGSHLTPALQVLVTLIGTGIATDRARLEDGDAGGGDAEVPSRCRTSHSAPRKMSWRVALSWAAMRHPLVAGGVALGLCVGALAGVWVSVKLVKAGLRRAQAWYRVTAVGGDDKVGRSSFAR